MYIAKRIISSNEYLYFEEDTRWTTDRSKAMTFADPKKAKKESDFTGLYDVIIEKIQ